MAREKLTKAQREMLERAVAHADGDVSAHRFQGPIANTLVKRGLLEDRRRWSQGLAYRITDLGRQALAEEADHG